MGTASGNHKASTSVTGIYAITKDSRVVYVGYSVNITQRWYQHQSDLRREQHKNPHLQSSWDYHGEESFEFIVLEECPVELLIEREQYHMDLHPDRYNVLPAAGSSLGHKHTDEARANMSAAAKRRRATPETKARMSASQMGHEVPPEARAKISASRKGTKATPETIARMRASQKARQAREREARAAAA